VLIGIGLASADLSRLRVGIRKASGGHDVPVERIYDRYPRVIENFHSGFRVASLGLLIDNSGNAPDSDSYEGVAVFSGGRLLYAVDSPPVWAQPIL
jgi:predicted ABC-type ATPase